jgi:hypothetical protein
VVATENPASVHKLTVSTGAVEPLISFPLYILAIGYGVTNPTGITRWKNSTSDSWVLFVAFQWLPYDSNKQTSLVAFDESTGTPTGWSIGTGQCVSRAQGVRHESIYAPLLVADTFLALPPNGSDEDRRLAGIEASPNGKWLAVADQYR